MRFAILPLAVLVATPAFADTSGTVKEVIARGAILNAMGQTFEFSYNANGTYTDESGADAGTWKAEGNKLCVTPTAFGQEICSEYPDGKKSGDTFDVTSDLGPATVTIK